MALAFYMTKNSNLLMHDTTRKVTCFTNNEGKFLRFTGNPEAEHLINKKGCMKVATTAKLRSAAKEVTIPEWYKWDFQPKNFAKKEKKEQ